VNDKTVGAILKFALFFIGVEASGFGKREPERFPYGAGESQRPETPSVTYGDSSLKEGAFLICGAFMGACGQVPCFSPAVHRAKGPFVQYLSTTVDNLWKKYDTIRR